MKKKFLLILAVAVFAVAGCTTVDKALLQPVQTIKQSATNSATGEVSPAVTNNAVVPNPTIESGLNTGKQFAGFLPEPYGTGAAGILAILSGALGLYAKARNGKLQTANAVISAVVAGVEAVNNADTKTAIQNAAAAAGVQSNLHPIVQEISAVMK
jgi:hypothetical protein